MNQLFKYLPFHFLLALVVGIVFQYYTHLWTFDFSSIVYCFVFLVGLFLIVYFFRIKNALFTFLSWAIFFFIGIIIVFVSDNRNYSNYFINLKKKQSIAVLEITDILKPNEYNQKYYARVIKIDNHKTIGKILLNIKYDSLKVLHDIGDRILLKPVFQKIKKPQNPYSFSFQQYLKNKGIFYQIYVGKAHTHLRCNSYSITRYAHLARKYIIKKLKQYDFSEIELSVVNALLLGDRKYISSDTTDSYIRAGATHILAVSGLHIGILLYILNFILKPVRRFQNGRIFSLILVLILLWSYAMLAGLSASIVRAVTMFSFLSLGQFYNRRMSVIFSLISSMLVLLIIKPLFLFDVGFQLSYVAVFSIVYLQPKIAQYYHPKIWMVKKLWQVATVSVAAQIGVLPLSIFYFHNLPLLFLVSNLVIVTFLGFVLGIGFIVILLALIGLLPSFIVTIYAVLIKSQNKFIDFIADQDTFFVNNLSISLSFLMVLYLVIVFGTRFLFFKREPKVFRYFLGLLLFLSIVSLLETYQRVHTTEFIVFNKSKNTIVGVRKGKNLFVDSYKKKDEVFLKPYVLKEKVNVVHRGKIRDLYQFKDQKIIVVDQMGVFDIQGIKNTILVLRNSPKINLSRLISKCHPKLIIADASNYKSYVNRWKKTSEKQKTPFHYTNEDGAFLLN